MTATVNLFGALARSRCRFACVLAMRPRPSVAAIVWILLLLCTAQAKKLPVRVYTTADGLPSNQISCNHKDSHGFLWFCTPEGLSRFDGYTFTNYGVDQGLPDRVVTDFLETKHGEYWVGTVRGVARFDPKPGANAPLFTVYGKGQTGAVNALQEDAHGTVWIACAAGLFQLVPEGSSWSLRRPELPVRKMLPEVFLADRDGNLWIAWYSSAGGSELLRVRGDGRNDIFTNSFLTDHNRITALTQDSHGRIWLSSYRGLGLLAPDPEPSGPFIQSIYTNLNRPTPEVGPVFQSSDGRLWVGGKGTWEIVTDPRGQIQFRMFDPSGTGFSLEDLEGNLWLGNKKIARTGFVSFGLSDGLKAEDIRSVFEGSDGELYVVSGIHGRYLHRFDGDHFTGVSPLVPGHDPDWDWGTSWGWGQINFQDHTGAWWIATGSNLLRYPKVKRLEDLGRTPPEKVYNDLDAVFRLFEDSRGDVWVGSWHGSARWERSSGEMRPSVQIEPTAFREDRAGNLWIGRWLGGLSRYRNGHDEWIIPPDDPGGTIFALFLDHAGRLWAGTTRRGLLRIDDPTADHPEIRVYNTHEGLSSNDVRAITEDHFGRIYFWTGRGVDRLNPDTGTIRHYTEADGLITTGADNNVAMCDRQGRLWFGLNGLSRLDPEPDRPPQPPPIRITKLKIRGVDYPVSELGETNLSGFELQPNENQIQIEFASLNFALGDVIRYQYKFDGVDPDWSPATDSRSVNFPRLPSGRYRFRVRAVNADGLVSATPAVISMRLLPPIWTRWWFVLTALSLATYAVFLVYRYRVRHLLELERVRTRIATDLHDDIGSSLTQIAIMSEVARKQSDHQSADEPLVHIANLSRELVDSMSDIVWAINPKRDHLVDLTQRMRRFVNDVLEAADIEVTFTAPQHASDTALSADVRREVFLIFKESVNNIVRHAQCRHVEVLVDLRSDELLVELRDDGLGFQVHETTNHGHGLVSMRERALRLGGELDVGSESGKGTTLRLTVPLGRSAAARQFPSLRR
jgi:ligand-binding sensor domain-containing protein/two-component sensor histidine kinase